MRINYLKIFPFILALFRGEIIWEPEKWKNFQLLQEALFALAFMVYAIFPDIQLGEAQTLAIVGVIAMVMGAFSTVLSTKKVGLNPDGRLVNVYKKVKGKCDGGDCGGGDDGGVQFSDQTEGDDTRLPHQTEPNSVNDGGKGLLGGHK